jgi:hypothetical protein
MPVAKLLGEIDRELHDLCQPLTRLSCHLELGQLRGDAASMREAVDTAISECAQVCQGVTRMRQRLGEMLERTRAAL